MATNIQVQLASRPTGWVTEANFKIAETPIPEPKPGQILVRNLWLSLDPYMRGRMSDAKSYSKPVEIGEVMVGGTVSEVLQSSHPKFKVGDFVVGSLGWQLYAASWGDGLTVIDPSKVPLSAYLGVCGMPGATAWTGRRQGRALEVAHLPELTQPRLGLASIAVREGGQLCGGCGFGSVEDPQHRAIADSQVTGIAPERRAGGAEAVGH